MSIPSATRARRPARTPPVAVVGSGLCAQVAAFRLLRAGQRVAWLELEPEEPDESGSGADAAGTGGNSVGPTGSAQAGAWDESPGAVLPASAPGLIGLAAELGLGKAVRRAPGLGIEWVGSEGARRRLGPGGSRGVEDGLFGLLARRRARRLLRWYGRWLDAAAPERGGRLDDRSAADWCRLYLGRRNLDRIVGPFLAASFGLDCEETSRLLLLSLLDPAGRPTVARVLGLGELSERLEASLSKVRRTQRVRSVCEGGRKLVLSNGRSLRTRATLLVGPADRVPGRVEELTPAERVMLPRLTYVDQLALRLRGSPALGPSGVTQWVPLSRPGPIAAIVAPPAPESLETTERELVLRTRTAFARGSAQRSDDEVRQTLLYAAEQLRPGLLAGVRTSQVERYPRALPAFTVGHYRAVERLHREREACGDRALLLCGGYQIGPHAEGEVVAGTRAAESYLSWSAARS